MAEMSDDPSTFMPRTRVMVRSGRSTRTERRADMPPVVAPESVSQPTTTTTKSSQFQPLHRYAFRWPTSPSATTCIGLGSVWPSPPPA